MSERVEHERRQRRQRRQVKADLSRLWALVAKDAELASAAWSDSCARVCRQAELAGTPSMGEFQAALRVLLYLAAQSGLVGGGR